jgi:hypothetical protein
VEELYLVRGLRFSGLLRRVIWRLCTDVSEDRLASISRNHATLHRRVKHRKTPVFKLSENILVPALNYCHCDRQVNILCCVDSVIRLPHSFLFTKWRLKITKFTKQSVCNKCTVRFAGMIRFSFVHTKGSRLSDVTVFMCSLSRSRSDRSPQMNQYSAVDRPSAFQTHDRPINYPVLIGSLVTTA